MNFMPMGKNGNALLRVAFVLQFERPFSTTDFEAFDRAGKGLQDQLPRRTEPQSLKVSLDELKVTRESVKGEGLSFERLAPDGNVELGLRFERNQILLLVGNYTKWNISWPEANNLLTGIMELIPGENSLASLSTEYVNLFRGTGGYEDFDASLLFLENSKFVPSHVFERTLNFHFHTGFFESHCSPGPHRVLTRINADLRDNPAEHFRDLTIVLFHSIVPDLGPWETHAALDPEVKKMGLRCFETIHENARKTLREIVAGDLAARIGLT